MAETSRTRRDLQVAGDRLSVQSGDLSDPKEIGGRQPVEDPDRPPVGTLTTRTTTRREEARVEVRRRALRLKPDELSGFIIVRVSPELSCVEGEGGYGSPPEGPGEERPGAPERPEGPVEGEPGGGRDDDDLCPLSHWFENRVKAKLNEAELGEDKPLLTHERPEIAWLCELLVRCPPRRLVQRLPPRVLLALEDLARASALPPLHSLASYWRIDARHLPGSVVARIVALLNELPEVDLAYQELKAVDSQGPPGDFVDLQGYRLPAPVGVDAVFAARQTSGTGGGVTVVDLEQGWRLDHVDLPPVGLLYGTNRDGVGTYRGNHGTAVLGELVARANGVGVDGIVPAADARVVSHYHGADTDSGQFPDTNGHVADAVVAVLGALRIRAQALQSLLDGDRDELAEGDFLDGAGELLLLEVQRSRKPTEVDEADFDAIRLAVALGVVVVEAAGNGAVDLDTYLGTPGYPFLDRGDPDFRDSGAILVGAAEAPVPHNRASFSNFGSRVDTFAWGEDVVTCGYGDVDPGGGSPNRTFTRTFGGTSAAAPIVTGAAAVLQGVYRARTGAVLFPRVLRRLLSDPDNGTPQGPQRAGNIGVMPDLQALLRRLGLLPRLTLRDGVVRGAQGQPVLVATAEGPDVLVRARTGGGARFQVRVKLRNDGLGDALGAAATVYGTDAATLVTPDMLERIGTAPVGGGAAGPTPVPQGGVSVSTNALRWNPPAGLLPTGHFSFLVLPGFDGNPSPDLPPSPPYFDWDRYRAFLCRYPVYGVQQVAAAQDTLPFLLCGTPQEPRVFDFEILQRLPAGARVTLTIPSKLVGPWLESLGDPTAVPPGLATTIPLPAQPRLTVSSVQLAAAGDWRRLGERDFGRYPCSFSVVRGAAPLTTDHGLVIRQLFDGEEVGSVAWRF